MMKADIFYKKLFLIVAILLCSSISYAQETVAKKIERSYPFSNKGELHINNKYGNININGWDKKSIKITLHVEVSHKKRENANSMLERIDADFNVNTNFISISTEINEKSSGFFAKYFDKVNPFDLNMSNVKINYTVYLPTTAEIDVTNKFGDVIISNWNGKLKATIEHGDAWINENLTKAVINMKFGKIKTRDLSYGTINLKNGELDLVASKQLFINSSGSKIYVDAINSLELNSSKDEITINEVTNLQGDLEFSKITVNTLGDEMRIASLVTELKIYSIRRPDSKIFIDQESSEININISGQSLRFTAVLEEGLLRIPTSFRDIDTAVINNGKKIREISANYGKGTPGEYTIKGLKGIIILKE